MLSNQKLQNSLNEIKEISHMDTALFTAKGKLVAHTEEMPLPEALEQQVVVDFAESLAEKQTYQDYHLYKVMVEGETEYILVCLVKEESFLVCAQMAVCQIRNLVMSFAEQFDRNNFMQNPEEFYRFYRNKMLCLDAQPNITHFKLAELEKAGKLKGVVTQNIDGLHQKAGSKNVMELHGSVLRNYCERCGQFVSAEDILHSEGVPVCPVCGGPVKPDVVLYEEGLNQKTLQDAVFYISHADMLIVGGTSLAVYPAAGLIDYYRGNKLVLINKSATPMDARADLLIQDGLGNVFSQIKC